MYTTLTRRVDRRATGDCRHYSLSAFCFRQPLIACSRMGDAQGYWPSARITLGAFSLWSRLIGDLYVLDLDDAYLHPQGVCLLVYDLGRGGRSHPARTP